MSADAAPSDAEYGKDLLSYYENECPNLWKRLMEQIHKNSNIIWIVEPGKLIKVFGKEKQSKPSETREEESLLALFEARPKGSVLLMLKHPEADMYEHFYYS